MDITAQQRAHLSQTLQRVLGEEASETMMAHLPHGGADAVATKDDLARLGEDLRAEIRRCATKDDLKAFATKDDLKAFATKDDLKAFATKDDLRAFATKEDLTVVKDELREVKGAVSDLKTTVDDMRQDLTIAMARSDSLRVELAAEGRTLRAEMASQADQLRTEWKDDLVSYIGRQTLIQVGTLLTIILASLAYITYVLP